MRDPTGFKKIKKAVDIPFKLGGGSKFYQVYEKGGKHYVKKGWGHFVEIRKRRRSIKR